MNVDDYASVLKRQLPRYKKIKLPTVDEETAKKVLAKLIAQGMNVTLEDGFFVLKDNENVQTTQNIAQKTETNMNQKTTTQTQQTGETKNVEREGNTITKNETKEVTQESHEQKELQKTTTQTQQTGETKNVEREGNIVVLGNTVRVCVRLKQGLVDALHIIYNEPSTSDAIRKAIIDLIQSRGYKIVYKEEDDVIDVDDILGEMRNE